MSGSGVVSRPWLFAGLAALFLGLVAALVFSGAGTDHLAVEDAKSIDDVIRAYEEQIAAVEKAGGSIELIERKNPAELAAAKKGKVREARLADRAAAQKA